jgi:hypothetical protein
MIAAVLNRRKKFKLIKKIEAVQNRRKTSKNYKKNLNGVFNTLDSH